MFLVGLAVVNQSHDLTLFSLVFRLFVWPLAVAQYLPARILSIHIFTIWIGGGLNLLNSLLLLGATFDFRPLQVAAGLPVHHQSLAGTLSDRSQEVLQVVAVVDVLLEELIHDLGVDLVALVHEVGDVGFAQEGACQLHDAGESEEVW